MTAEKIKSYLKLMRWFHELVAILPFVGLYFIINYYIKASGQNSQLPGFDFTILCICVQLLIAAGCVLNDIMDREIDKINKPKTHIVNRTVSLENAKKTFIIITILILVLSIYISLYVFEEWAFICTAVYILSIMYDVYFKRSPLIGNILVAALASFIPLVLFFFAKEHINNLHNERIVSLIYLYSLFPFMIIIPRELSLDISDMEGDKACGCRTLPIVIGIKKARIVVFVFITLIFFLSIFMVFKYPYLLLPFSVIDVLLLGYLFQLKKCEKRIEYIRAGRFLWFIMIIGLIGFTIATICF